MIQVDRILDLCMVPELHGLRDSGETADMEDEMAFHLCTWRQREGVMVSNAIDLLKKRGLGVYQILEAQRW